MLERLLIALLLIVIGLALYRLIIFVQRRRAHSVLHTLGEYEPGKLHIVYFTSPFCGPCRTTQRPALRTVESRLGEQLRIITIDVTEQPQIAEQWGVLTLPTTFIFHRSGQLSHYNIGAADAHKLISQLGAADFTTQQTERAYRLTS